MVDAVKNFAVSTVATAPSPATSGTTLSFASGDGTRMPATPFNIVVGPANTLLTPANSEIIRVTALSGDNVTTMVRAQEGSTARTIVVGDQVFAGVTAKMITDLVAMFTQLAVGASSSGVPSGSYIFRTGVGMTTDVQVFTSSGTWTKPAGAVAVEVTCIGGGGGGGAGGRGAAAAARVGGGGGGGGAMASILVPASVLGATEAVVVGAGGAGGTGAASDTTAGGNGVAGGVSSFGTVNTTRLQVNGGGAGTGGGAAGTGGGAGAAGLGVLSGSPGGVGSTTGAAGATPVVATAAGGGASGGGVTTANTATAGASGGLSYQNSSVTAATAGSASSGAGGAGNTSVPTGYPMPGNGGGGGGGNAAATTGGAGGAGGKYGAGGGGGGANLNGVVSGAGGAGALGIVVVVTTF